MVDVNVDVEFCNQCGSQIKFEELAKHIKEKHPSPSVKVRGHEGRRGSFEVKVNKSLVHSKLSTLAYPDYDDLSNIISEVHDGNPPRAPCKQQVITSCVIA